ncbi:MAG: hypothetical protein IJW66_00270 [Clostridia bacterium]|nr:hypothetical protein [Clostridia bacterium]
MSIFDEARAIETMIKKWGITQSEMAKRMGVSQSYIANKLRLLRPGAAFEERCVRLGLTERHARSLLRLSSAEEIDRALDIIEKKRPTVAGCEALVDLLHDADAPRRIGESSQAKRIDTFIKTLGESVKTLRSLGIACYQKIDYEKKKTYIYISIEN